uniref:Uncharacterized protein n=1 Tax=Lactuca sativa TaxID=4236 RepID=A0A9R1WVV9_LACSA|nr:hypothetical protein LSAT_V11C800426800 [Lactuca sativa]
MCFILQFGTTLKKQSPCQRWPSLTNKIARQQRFWVPVAVPYRPYLTTLPHLQDRRVAVAWKAANVKTGTTVVLFGLGAIRKAV